MKRFIINRWIYLLFTVSLFFIPLSGMQSYVYSEVLFITSENVPAETITLSQVKDIFMGTKVAWEDDTQIKLAIMKSGALHAEFVKEFIKKTPSQYDNFWRKMVFLGKGSFPQKLKSEEEMVNYVKSTDGAIGYVSSKDTVTNGIKLIKISD